MEHIAHGDKISMLESAFHNSNALSQTDGLFELSELRVNLLNEHSGVSIISFMRLKYIY